MLPVAPLMIEHRLIERMIKLMDAEINSIKQNNHPNIDFINTAIDFIRTYADKLHHGKEEDILFKDLAKKRLSAEHKKIMDELIQEHVLGRSKVKKLIEARSRYIRGEKIAVKEMLENMEILAKFYPKHIEKEDKRFFLPVMNYLNEQEKEGMLQESYEFDRKFIHTKYKDIVVELEGTKI